MGARAPPLRWGEDRVGGEPAGTLARGDLENLGHVAVLVSLAVVGGVGDVAGEVDDDIEGVSQFRGGEFLGDLGAGLHGAGDELADRRLRVGGVGGGDGPGSAFHQLDHLPHFRAADLPEDLAPQAEPETVDDLLLDRPHPSRTTISGPLTRPGAHLPRMDDVVLVGQFVEEQFELRLEGADGFPRVDLGAQRAHQRGLSHALCAGDHDRLPRLHRRPEEVRRDRAERTPLDQIGQGHITDPMAADHHRQARGVPGSSQPGTAIKREMQRRVRRRERTRVVGPGGQEGEELGQFLVAVGDRFNAAHGSVRQFDDDPVVAGDHDVLDLGVIDQRLQPAQSEHRIEHGLRQRFLLGRRTELLAAGQGVGGVLVQQLPDHCPALPVLLSLVPGRPAHQFGQPLGCLHAERGHQRPVDAGLLRGDPMSGDRVRHPHCRDPRGFWFWCGFGFADKLRQRVAPGRTDPAGRRRFGGLPAEDG